MKPLPKGTRRELTLALRAARVYATHLKQARQGLKGPADAAALELVVAAWRLQFDVEAVMRLASRGVAIHEKRARAAA